MPRRSRTAVLAWDHAGYPLKDVALSAIRAAGWRVGIGGPNRLVPGDDYPDAAAALVRVLRQGRAARGILICGSGIGACIAANKFQGIRAALAENVYSAHQGVEHDAANVLCLGARVTGSAPAAEMIRVFLRARFSRETRHRRRVAKVLSIEASEIAVRRRGFA